jgi:hypothetical protein
VLSERRNWLFAYDYKWCRETLLKKLKSQWQELSSVRQLGDRFSFQDSCTESVGKPENHPVFIYDPILIEDSGNGTHQPFSPGAFINPSAVQAYRLLEYLRYHVDQTEFLFEPLTSNITQFPRSSLLVLICGKYLAKDSQHSLVEFAQKGGNILFPFGLPQYDEQMESLEWKVSLTPKVYEGVTRKGNFWFAASALCWETELWQKLQNIISEVEKNRA